MKKKILVAGATGNLGSMICQELLNRGAEVIALLRENSDGDKLERLESAGVKVIKVDYKNIHQIASACMDVDCIVSALAGLADVIIETQSALLDGALEAGVKRFIPSDFCTDYNLLVPGENRNFDLRRTFKEYIDRLPIEATSIFNGAFADILKYNTPILNLKNKSIAYWGEKADWKLDFSTMENTAAFTAAVALDSDTPRDLHIASFQISPAMLHSKLQAITGQDFSIQKICNLEEFAQFIKKQRLENPAGETELYAKWQQSQYMYSMYTTQHPSLANDRYKDIIWTTSSPFLETFVKQIT